jgi:hypothetical protein
MEFLRLARDKMRDGERDGNATSVTEIGTQNRLSGAFPVPSGQGGKLTAEPRGRAGDQRPESGGNTSRLKGV